MPSRICSTSPTLENCTLKIFLSGLGATQTDNERRLACHNAATHANMHTKLSSNSTNILNPTYLSPRINSSIFIPPFSPSQKRQTQEKTPRRRYIPRKRSRETSPIKTKDNKRT